MGHVMPLGAGVDYFDLEFLGLPGIIATGLIHGRDGVAIVDPGPTPCLPVLERALAERGFRWADVRAVLLTHIHLDHAAATGTIADLAPDAVVYVHERGAPHIVDPSKLMASASRLYLDDMDRLWGEMRPVPEDRLRVIGTEASMTVAGHTLRAAWTPGHAWHHVSYFLPDAGLAFVGDTAGIVRPGGRLVLPPTPPPDINLEAWQASIEVILGWNPDTLFLTHFGPRQAPRVHMQSLWREMDRWVRKVEATLARADVDDARRAEAFAADIESEIARSASAAEATSYARAGRFDFSWAGLARYLRKRPIA